MYVLKQRKRLWIPIFLAIILAASSIAGCTSGNKSGKRALKDESGMNANTASSPQFQNLASAGNSEKGSINESKNKSLALNEADRASDSGEAEVSVTEGFLQDTSASVIGMNQKIIYSANLTMKVDELSAASAALRDAIQQSGAYILEFSDTRHNGEIGANYKIKVPASGFMSFVDRLEQIENRGFERKISGQDVSEEYVDLESRLKARELVEERLLGMMDSATKADDLLKFSQQLSSVQKSIEQIKGRIRYLDSNVAFSSVELHMVQIDQSIARSDSDTKTLGGKLAGALQGSTNAVLQALQLLLIIMAGALPVLAVLAVIGIPAAAIIKYRRRQKRQIKSNESD